MDNVQKRNICVNIPSTQMFISYLALSLLTSRLWNRAAGSFKMLITTYQATRFHNQENHNLIKDDVEYDSKNNEDDTNKENSITDYVYSLL
jgi:hypothetical protein